MRYLLNGTIILECGGTIRTKRPRNRGFGLYHRLLQVDTESRILNSLHRYKRFGYWYSLRDLQRRTGIEMKTLRKTIARLVKQKRIEEYKGTRHSRLFCLPGTRDHIHYCEELRKYTSYYMFTVKESEKLLSKFYKKNKEGIMIRRKKDLV